MNLGVFDSGIGGEAIAASLRLTFPEAVIHTVNDHMHIPYGDKAPSEVIRLTNIAIGPLLSENCDIIVLACNTATALAISWLRARYPTQKFIGIEPMIKPAVALTKSNIIAICATPATLASDRYQKLIQKYGSNVKIIEPDCRDWAYLIEHNQLNQETVERTISGVCDQGADVIVLGCTHYHWIKDLITTTAAGRATILEPSEAIGRRVQQLLQLR